VVMLDDLVGPVAMVVEHATMRREDHGDVEILHLAL